MPSIQEILTELARDVIISVEGYTPPDNLMEMLISGDTKTDITNAVKQIKAQQRERVEKVIISSKKVNEYMSHPDHCGIHMTEFCDCGLREARIEWKTAIKELEAE